jgi:two-component system OmpR family sensor kinase
LNAVEHARKWRVRALGLPWSFRRQIVVLTAAITAVGMLLLSLVLQIGLARITSNDVDRVLEDRALSVVTSIQANSDPGAITVPDPILGPGVAVFDESAELVAGSIPPSLLEYYEDLAATTTPAQEDVGGPSSVRAEPFITSEGARGVVVVTESLQPYEEAESLALIASLVTGGIATAVAAGIAGWATRRALRPVAEMASTASDWSEHDLGRRFAPGPPRNEISALAGTLDTLLDKVSSTIRSEQRLTSELAHELRTPLTSIQGTADLILMREGPLLGPRIRADLVEISASSRHMGATISTLLDLARSAASVTAAATCGLLEVVGEVVDHALADAVRITVYVDDHRLALPHALAVRTLSPVVENAIQFARETVSLRSRLIDGSVELLVQDDGPGVDAVAADDIFQPGRTSETGAGAGLGLAISRRIARSAGGDVHVVTADVGSDGGRFVVRLPLA